MNEQARQWIGGLLDRIITESDLEPARVELAGILRRIWPKLTEERADRIARVALTAMREAAEKRTGGARQRHARLAVWRAILAELIERD